jgi:anti-sigma B factor antagonist
MASGSGSAFAVRERLVDGVAVLSFSRGLKGEGEEALKQLIDDLVRRGQLRVLIDLGEVPYLDSSDLGRLIRCHISIRQAGGRVRLCRLSERVRGIMKMTRLDTVMEIYDTEAAALASLAGPDLRPPAASAEAAAE